MAALTPPSCGRRRSRSVTPRDVSGPALKKGPGIRSLFWRCATCQTPRAIHAEDELARRRAPAPRRLARADYSIQCRNLLQPGPGCHRSSQAVWTSCNWSNAQRCARRRSTTANAPTSALRRRHASRIPSSISRRLSSTARAGAHRSDRRRSGRRLRQRVCGGVQQRELGDEFRFDPTQSHIEHRVAGLRARRGA